jgi:drug/metabolite transporter (DMT)-like permease
VITYVMPAVAVVLGILVLSESFTVATAVGLALILGGTALSTARERPPRRARRPAAVAVARRGPSD